MFNWFHPLLKYAEDKYLHKLGNVSYSKWVTSSDNKNLIVLLHGGGAHKNGGILLAQIKEIGNIIAIDLPGMGYSDFREKYSIVDYGNVLQK